MERAKKIVSFASRSLNMKPYYITTTLPYVNAAPHIGFALEITQADVIARYKRNSGHEVIFNTGTDEHGAKIYEKALEEGKDPQAYVDEYAAKFNDLKEALNLTYTNFTRTTDPRHAAAAREFWKLCDKSGDIYKKTYSVKYCVGCELEKTDSELENGRCPIHPNRELEAREEENYFFRFSKYAEALLGLYEDNPEFVVPSSRSREIATFVKSGLQDFSISRLKEKMPWGIEVPGDSDHVMYVWFDALINYISVLDWPENLEKFNEYWPGVQLAGKDNLRQQSAMWQAMLLSAGLKPSRQIVIHGFVTNSGQKMSKSLGNVVNPIDLVNEYGTDAVRYWLLREMSPFEDGDYTSEKFAARYEGDLVNGLGNFASRVTTLAEKYGPFESKAEKSGDMSERVSAAKKDFSEKMEEYKFHEALMAVWDLVQFGDVLMNQKKPWESGDKIVLADLVYLLREISAICEPFIPATSAAIVESITDSGADIVVKKVKMLFPRKTDK